MDFPPSGIVSSFDRAPWVPKWVKIAASLDGRSDGDRDEGSNHHTKQIIGGRSMTIPSYIWIIWFIYVYIYIELIFQWIIKHLRILCTSKKDLMGCTPGWALKNDQRLKCHQPPVMTITSFPVVWQRSNVVWGGPRKVVPVNMAKVWQHSWQIKGEVWHWAPKIEWSWCITCYNKCSNYQYQYI